MLISMDASYMLKRCLDAGIELAVCKLQRDILFNLTSEGTRWNTIWINYTTTTP